MIIISIVHGYKLTRSCCNQWYEIWEYLEKANNRKKLIKFKLSIKKTNKTKKKLKNKKNKNNNIR